MKNKERKSEVPYFTYFKEHNNFHDVDIEGYFIVLY